MKSTKINKLQPKTLEDLSTDTFGIIVSFNSAKEFVNLMRVSKNIHKVVSHPKFVGTRYMVFRITSNVRKCKNESIGYVRNVILMATYEICNFQSTNRNQMKVRRYYEVAKSYLAAFSNIKCVNFCNLDVSQFSGTLEKLEVMKIYSSELPDNFLERIMKLRVLYCDGYHFNSKAFSASNCKKNFPNLKVTEIHVDLEDNHGNKQTSQLQKLNLLPNLKILTIKSAQVNLNFLPAFPQLRSLSIESNEIKLGGQFFRSFQNLESLTLKRKMYWIGNLSINGIHDYIESARTDHISADTNCWKLMKNLQHLNLEHFRGELNSDVLKYLPNLRSLNAFCCESEFSKNVLQMVSNSILQLEELKMCKCKPKRNNQKFDVIRNVKNGVSVGVCEKCGTCGVCNKEVKIIDSYVCRKCAGSACNNKCFWKCWECGDSCSKCNLAESIDDCELCDKAVCSGCIEKHLKGVKNCNGCSEAVCKDFSFYCDAECGKVFCEDCSNDMHHCESCSVKSCSDCFDGSSCNDCQTETCSKCLDECRICRHIHEVLSSTTLFILPYVWIL